MYRVCSLYRCCKVRLVCPTYERLQALEVSLYMPLLSYSILCLYGVYCSNCCMVFVVLYVICRFVHLNRLVIVRMVGLKYVKVVLILQECDVVIMLLDLFLFCGMCCFIRLMCFMGNTLVSAMVCIICCSVCWWLVLNGSECSRDR